MCPRFQSGEHLAYIMVSRYELHGWRRSRSLNPPANGFVMQPGLRTFVLRLRVTVWALLLIAAVWFLSITIPRAFRWNPPIAAKAIATPQGGDEQLQRDIADIQKRLPAAAQRRIAQNEAARQQRFAALAARNRAYVAAVRWAAGLVIAILAFIGAAAPLSAFWNRLMVICPQPRTLQLTETGLWRHRRTISLTDEAAVVLAQYQLRSRGAGFFSWLPGTRSWAWVLVLSPGGHAAAERVEFWLESLSTPAAATDLPESEMAEFVRPLGALIRVQATRTVGTKGA